MQYREIQKRNPRQSESNSRWWESYLVRYAIGTIIGALCVYALLNIMGGNVMAKALMMPSISEEKLNVLTKACQNANANACVAQLQFYHDLYGFNLPQLILLGIYGLGYCYIASVPGLVAHAVRRQLVSGDCKCSSPKKWYVDIRFVAIFLAVIVLVLLAVLVYGGAFPAALVVVGRGN